MSAKREIGCYVMEGVMYTSHSNGSETSRKATPEEVLMSDALQNCRDQLSPEPRGSLIEDEDGAPVSQAAHDVIVERSRQVSVEGWTPEHDDEHSSGEMALAGGCYALHAVDGFHSEDYTNSGTPYPWPFDREWWKPKDVRRDLVRAAALLIAEIERLDRQSPETKSGEQV